MVKVTGWVWLLVAAAAAAEDAPASGARLLHKWAAGEACVGTIGFLTDDTPVAIDLTGSAASLADVRAVFPKTSWPGLTCSLVLADGVVFVGLASGEVWRWDLATRRRERASSRHCSTVACAAVSPDGRLIATGS